MHMYVHMHKSVHIYIYIYTHTYMCVLHNHCTRIINQKLFHLSSSYGVPLVNYCSVCYIIYHGSLTAPGLVVVLPALCVSPRIDTLTGTIYIVTDQ